MKKISLSNIKNSLTKYELNKIMAGSSVITNTNGYSSCTCYYQNRSVITNDNTVTTCQCYCTK